MMKTSENLHNSGISKPFFEFIVNSDLSISLSISCWITIALIALILLIAIIKVKGYSWSKDMEIDGAEIGIGDQKIKLKLNDVDLQIAYKVWVELSTRKIGLPVDVHEDVISEVYDSWYHFFGVTRELIKEIPPSKLRRKETLKIVELSIDVLNKGIRPHLTTWQAKFRRWYEMELSLDTNKNKTPQDIQKQFPEFNQLMDDLKQVNNHLMKYRKKMRELSFGRHSN